jgi:large subunit ribosomal protein L23
MQLKDILKKPIITEKTTQANALGRYTFEVDRRADKRQIARAVEEFFEVHVQKVWTMTMAGKKKKAVVQLAEGEKIDLIKTGD